MPHTDSYAAILMIHTWPDICTLTHAHLHMHTYTCTLTHAHGWIDHQGGLHEQFLIAKGFIWIREIWHSQRLVWVDLGPSILTRDPGRWTSVYLGVAHPCTWPLSSWTSVHLFARHPRPARTHAHLGYTLTLTHAHMYTQAHVNR